MPYILQHVKIYSPVLCRNDLNILKFLQKDDSIVVSRPWEAGSHGND